MASRSSSRVRGTSLKEEASLQGPGWSWPGGLPFPGNGTGSSSSSGPLRGAPEETAPKAVAGHDVTVPLKIQKCIPENLFLTSKMSLKQKLLANVRDSAAGFHCTAVGISKGKLYPSGCGEGPLLSDHTRGEKSRAPKWGREREETRVL